MSRSKSEGEILKNIGQNICLEKGVALAEIAIILPFLVLTIFSGIEFTRILRLSEIASGLSREAANLAFRECFGRDATSHAAECLDAGRNALQSVVDIVPGSRIIVSLYSFEGGAATLVAQSANASSRPDFVSHFSVSGNAIQGIQDSTLLPQGRGVVIAEVYVPSPTILGLSALGILQDYRYEMTVL